MSTATLDRATVAAAAAAARSPRRPQRDATAVPPQDHRFRLAAVPRSEPPLDQSETPLDHSERLGASVRTATPAPATDTPARTVPEGTAPEGTADLQADPQAESSSDSSAGAMPRVHLSSRTAAALGATSTAAPPRPSYRRWAPTPTTLHPAAPHPAAPHPAAPHPASAATRVTTTMVTTREPHRTPAPQRSARATATATATATAVQPISITNDAVPMWDHDSEVAVMATPSAVLPRALDSAAMLARAVLESMAGRRDVAQLRAHCAPDVFAGLLDQPVLGRGGTVQLVSVWTCEPHDGCAEVSAIFQSRGRVRAMALRMQGIDGAWRVTSLQLG